MQAIQSRFTFLFRSTKWLVLVAIAAIALVTAIFGMLSGPMVEWGVKDVVVRLLGLDLQRRDLHADRREIALLGDPVSSGGLQAPQGLVGQRAHRVGQAHLGGELVRARGAHRDRELAGLAALEDVGGQTVEGGLHRRQRCGIVGEPLDGLGLVGLGRRQGGSQLDFSPDRARRLNDAQMVRAL